MKKSSIRARGARIMAVAMILCMLVVFGGTGALAANTAVSNASSGVLQFNLVYTDDLNAPHVIATGSCFLINANTIVTANHCTVLTEDQLTWLAELMGKTVEETNNRLSYSVTISRDVTITARITQRSAEMDYAILQLESSLQNKNPLAIRHSSDVKQTESVYAIGFPAQSANIQTINTYTTSDVTITNGNVNKIATGSNIWNDQPSNFVEYLQTSCKLTAGYSGGPMLDANGYVVGVCMGTTGEFTQQGDVVVATDDYYYAVCIDQVLEVCDALGIVYTPASAEPAGPEPSDPGTSTTPSTPEPDSVDTDDLTDALSRANTYKSSSYTASSFAALEDAIAKGNRALTSNDQDKVDDAVDAIDRAIRNLEEVKTDDASADTSIWLYIVIAAVAVVIILVVVIIVVINGKKKTPPQAQPHINNPGSAAPRPANGGFIPSTPTTPGGVSGSGVQTAPIRTTTVQSAGATTVLNQGGNETTVLSQQVHGGFLIRKKNGERVEINKAEFIVGRERNRVTYCISDNSNVGRTHAKLSVRGGVTYLVDMNSTNGTFVNKTRCTPNQEVALKNGDEITLADEVFDYRS